VNLCLLKNAAISNKIIRIGTTVDNTRLMEENGRSRDIGALFNCSTNTGFSTIKLARNSQCIDVIGNVVAGAQVFVNPANNSDTQQWEFQSA